MRFPIRRDAAAYDGDMDANTERRRQDDEEHAAVREALSRGETDPPPPGYAVVEAGPVDAMREDLMTLILEDEARHVA